MKKQLIATIAGLAMSASALAASTPMIGIVNVQQIFASSSQVKAQKTALRSEFSGKHEKLKSAQTKLEDMMKNYQRNQSVMSAKQLQSLKTQIAAQQSKVMQMSQLYTDQAEKAQGKAMNKFLGELRTAAESVAKQKHLDLVLANTSVVYASNELNVTKDVEAQLK